jgi:hypothetical protein
VGVRPLAAARLGVPPPACGGELDHQARPEIAFLGVSQYDVELVASRAVAEPVATNAARLLQERRDRTGRADLQGCIGSAALVCAHEHVGHTIRLGGR